MTDPSTDGTRVQTPHELLAAATVSAKADRPDAPPGYELGEEIGRGGMGVVYRARDTILGRDVAVKLLRPELAAWSGVARQFVEEARITAQLTHPGVPAIHALGTLPDGRPFLAMKLVRGNTLANLLAERHDPSADRSQFVAAFEAVCQAVAHAHAQGVIHRDLKPGNVMVGAFGEVQVMDWGLAKVLGGTDDPPSRERRRPELSPIHSTRAAEDGTVAGSVLGTPAYMPPEQAAGRTDEIDRRSDVFGLGAVLCAILTGKPPYQGANPESTRELAADGDLSDALARLDACGADPGLVALCKRCLSPNRADRPADAGEVAAAVARLRAAAEERAHAAERERVAADTRAAEERKRRRVALRLGSGIIGALLIGGTVSAWQAVRATNAAEAETKARIEEGKARDAEHEAAELARKREGEAKEALKAEAKAKAEAVEREKKEKAARQSAEEVAAFMKVIFAGEGTSGEAGRNRDAARKRTVLEAMNDAAGKIEGKFGDRPEVEAEVRNTIGKTYWEIGAYPEAEAQLRRALELWEKASGPDHPDTLLVTSDLAVLLLARGDLAGAEPLCRRAVAGLEKARGPDHPDTLRSVNVSADLLRAKGNPAGAEPLYRRALAGREKALGPDHPDTLRSANNLAVLLDDRGDLAGAEPLYRRVLAGREKALGPDHPETLTLANNLAALLYSRGDLAGAERLWRRALEGREKALGPDHPDTLLSANNLGFLLRAKGDVAGAERLYRRALAGREKVLGPDHPDTLTITSNLGILLHDAGRFGEAVPLFERAYLGNSKRPERALPALFDRLFLGLSLVGDGRPAEAEPHLVAGYEGLSKQKVLTDRNRNRMRWAAAGLVEVYQKTGRPEKAAEWRSKLAALPPEVAPPPRALVR